MITVLCNLNSLKVHLPVGQVACEQALLGRPGVRGWGREEGKEICLPRRQSAPRELARGLSGKLRTGSTTRIAKFTSPGLSDAKGYRTLSIRLHCSVFKKEFRSGVVYKLMFVMSVYLQVVAQLARSSSPSHTSAKKSKIS